MNNGFGFFEIDKKTKKSLLNLIYPERSQSIIWD
jgi:hypothetical protein